MSWSGLSPIGPALAVWASGPPVSSAARLFDPRTGRRLADIGMAGAAVELWAGGQRGRVVSGTLPDGRVVIVSDGVLLVDVATGKVATLPISTCRE